MIAFEKKFDSVYYLECPYGGCFTGITLIKGKKNYIIDSAGSKECITDILIPALNALDLEITDIDYLLNTHTHADHIGGHETIKALSPSTTVITYRKSEDKVRDPLKYNRMIREVFPKHSPQPNSALRGVEPDLIIDDGYVLLDELMFISCEGHDDDSGAWLHIPSGTLICGDSLQLNGTSVQGIALYMDLISYKNTIKKLRTLKLKNLIAGHDYIPLGAYAAGEEAVDAYLRTCEEYVEEYHRYIRIAYSKGMSAPEIAKALIHHVGAKEPQYLFLPLYTVTEHLKEISKEQ